MQLDDIQELFAKKPYLAWYVKDRKKLSLRSMFEHILHYGQWNDYLLIEKVVGVRRLKDLFLEIKKEKRINLRPQTINYFENYFRRYA